MAGSRAGIGAFTVAVAVVVGALGAYGFLFGSFVVCFDDTGSRSGFCDTDHPDLQLAAAVWTPILVLLVIGAYAVHRRSWRLAFAGAAAAVVVLVVSLGVAILIDRN